MIALGLLILTGEYTILNAEANRLLQGTGSTCRRSEQSPDGWVIARPAESGYP